ncbi:MAG: NfeD family protein [Bacteroides sp.]|nr:NfeD family protein [Prevotella sp.]MCM1408317.1 NfeD family protein [Treponema brennaborense]MCM1470451.1 NfeD family protein [Bacteroides sp.]
MDIIIAHLQWFWLCLCIILLIIELATAELTTIWFAAGAAVMMFISFSGIPFLWQLLIYVIISSSLLLCVRPSALKKLKSGREKTNSERLIGQKVRLAAPVSETQKGTVIINDVAWSARTDDGAALPAGQEAVIARIEGATLIVEPLK